MNSPETLSKLCLRCGLCCDGTLFARVPVSSAERDRLLAAKGVAVETRPDGSLALPQRCAALDGCACTAYEARPARCREYRCNLYAAVEESEVGFDEALGVIDGALQRLRALGAACFGASDDGGAVVSRYRKVVGAPAATELSPSAQAAFSELQAWLDRHFRGRK